MKHNQKGFGALEGVLILVIIGIVGFAGWDVYASPKKTSSVYENSSTDIATKVTKKSTATDQTANTAPSSPISDTLKDNTAAAIESQNTAALEGYMADSVTVVIAASEKGGAESATLAVKDLDYLKAGTSPWDFNLPVANLTAYKNGDYKQYFGTNTIVGKSANGYVVAFGINNAGKIDTVFMAANSSLLE